MKLEKLMVAFGLIAACANANATIVFDGGSPNQDELYNSSSSGAYAMWASTKFVLNQGISFNRISWWGSYGGYASIPEPSQDAFTLRIFEDYGSTPGIEILSVAIGSGHRSATGGTIDGQYGDFDEYAFYQTFGNIDLAAGSYYLSLVNAAYGWGWETTAGGSQMGGATAWLGWVSNPAENLAFKLEHNVPEPGTLALLGLGLAGLGALRRRTS